MSHWISKLCQLSQQDNRLILGLMSGTSLDGLDLALCRVNGRGLQTSLELLRFSSLPYDVVFKDNLRKVFAQKTVDLQFLALMNAWVGQEHARLILETLARWGVSPEQVDLIASHGQTIMHAPRHLHQLPDMPNATLQIGDGDHIAHQTGIITISDFRQKHVAAGGEGAPLAIYGDYFLYTDPKEDRILLNIGGIANFTFLPAGGDSALVFATDTGPGNTLLDAFARALFEQECDKDGILAKAGRVSPALLEALLQHPFFQLPMPKTTGPEMFNAAWVNALLQRIPKGNNNPFDIMATLTRFTAITIADMVAAVNRKSAVGSIYVSGGGVYNPALMADLEWAFGQQDKKGPGWDIRPFDELGIAADAKEAVLFAVLANESIMGQEQGLQLPGGLSVGSLGKISLPG